MGVAATQHTVRGNISPYSELHGSYLLHCSGYDAGQLAWPVPTQVRLGCLLIQCIQSCGPSLLKDT